MICRGSMFAGCRSARATSLGREGRHGGTDHVGAHGRPLLPHRDGAGDKIDIWVLMAQRYRDLNMVEHRFCGNEKAKER